MRGVLSWRRFLAFIVDGIIVDFVITRPLNKTLLNNELSISSFNEFVEILGSYEIMMAGFLIGVLGVLYWSILEYKTGKTLGALIFNLKARSEYSRNLSFGQSLIRNITKLSFGLLFLDSLFILFSDKRQRLFEKISKTVTSEGE